MLFTSLPGTNPSAAYYDCRYAVLREPLGFTRGAELLGDDNQAIHAWIELDGKVVSVGRAHLIPEESDGSGADHKGPGAAKIPGFGPLSDENNRPAVQIRQMGTIEQYRRRGFAAEVLSALESSAKQHSRAKLGLLQAREHAVPFYLSQGWEIIDQPYDIDGIGPHRSMMKYL
ncbi:MAG: GNAT family N-acetyltransferase [Candidatus Thermoplasmatota archaeon]|nr:GNAT family N-acetyltransferase [Candidatus Thermoplasmatota archaeon]